jgi:hypothetical protein
VIVDQHANIQLIDFGSAAWVQPGKKVCIAHRKTESLSYVDFSFGF